MLAKTADEFHILGTIKIFSYFSFVLSIKPKRMEFLKMSKVMYVATLPQCRNGRQEQNQFFRQSLLHPAVSREEIPSFLKQLYDCGAMV